jgi:AraC family transcriptional regulator
MGLSQTIEKGRTVLRRRIERARLLLLAAGLGISEIVYLTGFAHQSHLAHWMRREIGETPRGLKRAGSRVAVDSS